MYIFSLSRALDLAPCLKWFLLESLERRHAWAIPVENETKNKLWRPSIYSRARTFYQTLLKSFNCNKTYNRTRIHFIIRFRFWNLKYISIWYFVQTSISAISKHQFHNISCLRAMATERVTLVQAYWNQPAAWSYTRIICVHILLNNSNMISNSLQLL